MALGKTRRPCFTDDLPDAGDETAVTGEGLTEAEPAGPHEKLWRALREHMEHDVLQFHRALTRDVTSGNWPHAETLAIRLTDMCAHLRLMDALEANIACIVKTYTD